MINNIDNHTTTGISEKTEKAVKNCKKLIAEMEEFVPLKVIDFSLNISGKRYTFYQLPRY